MVSVSKLDEKGRILIPKKIRDKLHLNKNSPVRIYLKGSKIIIEPILTIKKVRARKMEEVFFDAGEATFGE